MFSAALGKNLICLLCSATHTKWSVTTPGEENSHFLSPLKPSIGWSLLSTCTFSPFPSARFKENRIFSPSHISYVAWRSRRHGCCCCSQVWEHIAENAVTASQPSWCGCNGAGERDGQNSIDRQERTDLEKKCYFQLFQPPISSSPMSHGKGSKRQEKCKG